MTAGHALIHKKIVRLVGLVCEKQYRNADGQWEDLFLLYILYRSIHEVLGPWRATIL